MGGGDALERESEEEGRGKLSSEMEIYRRIYCADLSSPRPPPGPRPIAEQAGSLVWG